jgi:glycosyltransferase involved in cell wall biosynthesis
VFATNLIQQVQPEKPRILFLTNLPAPYRMSLFNALSKDFEVTVGFTGGADGGRQWQLPERSQLKFNVLDSGRLIGLGKLKFPFPRKGIRRHIRESNLVVVGGWSSLVYIYGLLLAKRLDIRSAVWFESTLQSSLSQSSFLKKFKARIFSLGAFVLTPGESSSEAVTNYSSNEAPVVQISNPVEDVFIPRSANNVSDSGPRGVTKYLYFGRLLSWKCVDQLIHAFSNLPDDNVSLTIIGTGPELMKLKQLAHLSNKSDRIEFREMVPYTEALSIYSKYDVLVLPSNREVWGLVVPEALLTGLTVVAADSVGCVKSFKEVERLLLFETNSVESLTMTMHAATQRINLSEASYERLRVLNSSVSFAAAFKQFYSGAYSSRLLETNRKLEINKP